MTIGVSHRYFSLTIYLYFEAKPRGFANEGADLDDLLDGFDFNQKSNPRTDTVTANSTLDTSFGNISS